MPRCLRRGTGGDRRDPRKWGKGETTPFAIALTPFKNCSALTKIVSGVSHFISVSFNREGRSHKTASINRNVDRPLQRFINCEGRSSKTVSISHKVFKREERARRPKADSNRQGPSAYQPNLLPLGQACSVNSLTKVLISKHGA